MFAVRVEAGAPPAMKWSIWRMNVSPDESELNACYAQSYCHETGNIADMTCIFAAWWPYEVG
jgi:hypothetical protein